MIDFTTIVQGGIGITVVFAFMRGWVLPRSTLRDRIAGYEKEIERANDDRDDWRDVARAKDTVIFEQSQQISALLDGNRTTHAFIRSLPQALGQPGGESGQAGADRA